MSASPFFAVSRNDYLLLVEAERNPSEVVTQQITSTIMQFSNPYNDFKLPTRIA